MKIKMKKLFLGLAFLGLLFFATPATVKAEGQECGYVSVSCENGNSFMAIICSEADLAFFRCYYCNHCDE